jgi:hypothetical protein
MWKVDAWKVPSILTPLKDNGQPRALEEILYNRRHRQGRSVVENAFGLLKKSWRELLHKPELHIILVPDVVNACCILYNLTVTKTTVAVEEAMERLT